MTTPQTLSPLEPYVFFEPVLKALVPKQVRPRLRAWYQSFLYQGDRVECPCCGHTASRFLPFGEGKRRLNAQCQQCKSLERHRLLWLYLKERTPLLTEPLSLLHIAPETFLGRTLRALPNIDYLSGDLESPAAMVKMDITDIQYPDASFDVILCNHVLEHVPADRQAMRELYRVLKPGGWAILQVPIDESRAETLEDPTIVTPEARQQYYGQYDHVRLYGRDYAERLSEVGFRVERDVFCQQLPSGQIGRFALQTDEAIYRCWRPL